MAVTEPPGHDHGRRRRWDGSAWIPAAAAILGTLVGGFATYVGNQQLQDHQIAQEEARQTASARAIARLLMNEYQIDIKHITYMRGAGEYQPASYSRHTFVTRIGLEDRKLLAGQLSARHWIKVSAAAQEIEVVAGDLEAHRGRGTVGPYELETLTEADTACSQAFEALRPLGENESSS